MLGAWHNIHVVIITVIEPTAMATKRKAYMVTTKLQAMKVAENTSKEAATRQFAVDLQRIREWCAKKTG